MTGLVLWDAIIWAVLGGVVGWTATAWGNLRIAMALAVIVTLVGLLIVLGQVAMNGVDGLPAAAAALLFSVPATLGLALGGLAAQLILRPR